MHDVQVVFQFDLQLLSVQVLLFVRRSEHVNPRLGPGFATADVDLEG